MAKGKRSTARLAAVQGVYAFEISQEAGTAVQANSFIKGFLACYSTGALQDAPHNNERVVLDLDLATKLATQTLQELPYIDGVIVPLLAEGWKIERLHSTLRAILRIAVCEMAFASEVPARVLIDEYTSLAGEFADKSEINFINGILDKIACKLRSGEMSGQN